MMNGGPKEIGEENIWSTTAERRPDPWAGRTQIARGALVGEVLGADRLATTEGSSPAVE
jgi:hypothetical protein